MEIRAEDVRRLRERTGAGMMECKKALTEAQGDIPKAEKILKELGLAAAAKRSGRATNEGSIFTVVKGKVAAILELTCETDFVARNEKFRALGDTLVSKVVEKGLKFGDECLQAMVTEAVARIKENITNRRLDTIAAGGNESITSYVHGDDGRVGVLVKVQAERPELLEKQQVKEFAFNCALHVAAFRPLYLSEAGVDEPYRKEQEEIFTVQAKNLGKPENVLAGIVKGKLKKLYSEICLLDQPFVKDDKRSVAQVAQDVGKEAGGKVSVTDFRYYSVGEDLGD